MLGVFITIIKINCAKLTQTHTPPHIPRLPVHEPAADNRTNQQSKRAGRQQSSDPGVGQAQSFLGVNLDDETGEGCGEGD